MLKLLSIGYFKRHTLQKLRDDAIRITSQGDTVIMEGSVLDSTHQLLAQETMAGLPGVKSVDNRLQVKNDIPMADKDAWIKTKAGYMLDFHRKVNNSGVEIEVKNGNVVLRGSAADSTQRKLIAQYVKVVEGVKTVRNEMTILESVQMPREAMADMVDDVSVNALVKVTLLYHCAEESRTLKEAAKDGVVIVKWGGMSRDERDANGMLFCDVQGVKYVLDGEDGVTAYCAMPAKQNILAQSKACKVASVN